MTDESRPEPPAARIADADSGPTSVSEIETDAPSHEASTPPVLETALRQVLDSQSDELERAGAKGTHSESFPTNGPRVVAKMEHDDSLYVLLRVPLENREQLTRREIEVVVCIGEGLRNREIAERLGISSATVAAHVRNIFRKLRVKTRTECARYVLTSIDVES